MGRNVKDPPFKEIPIPDGQSWSRGWYEWLRELWIQGNRSANQTGDGTENHFVDFDGSNYIRDSGKTKPTGEVVGTTDSQVLTNKSFPDPTEELHAVNKQYGDQNYLQRPLDTVVSETVYAQASTAGVSPRYSRGDHTHGTPIAPIAVGGIYFNVTGVNPNTELGYGTWNCVAAGDLTLT